MAPKVALKKLAAERKARSTEAKIEMERKLAEAVKLPIVTHKPPSSQAHKEAPTHVELQVERKGSNNKKRKMSRESYKFYIFKVLKQVHHDVGISNKAMLIMDNLVNDIFDKLSSEACKLAKYAKKNTVTSREIQAAAKLMIPGELCKHAVCEGTKAVAKFIG
ncbi:hypothetical protein SUGI_1067250 [Cryptomeria japonica]|uniref:uncharacterized protein LOC131036040 n=1 Tax=Cryptomeria japonica TaxID=3369 RepID=UPI00241489E8|nr:uncharacterized protein LOC131036040 [Cryptomeria japonica]GLJ50160.1 hypothetical protein SUGI_1067250 [Cryptomeria japonica]